MTRTNADKLRWLSFEEATEKVRSLGIKGVDERYRLSSSGKRPVGIPSNPSKFYKDKGWTNWGDFLVLEQLHSLKENIGLLQK